MKSGKQRRFFVSSPVVLVAEEGVEHCGPNLDPAYERLRKAFGCMEVKDEAGSQTLPRASLSGGDLAAGVIRRLLNQAQCQSEDIDLLVDCRSSTPSEGPAPTYRLAAQAGLPHALCWSLSGQAGAEVGEALLLAEPLVVAGGSVAIVSAVQAVLPPDRRSNVGSYPLGDAAAAVLAYTNGLARSASDFEILRYSATQGSAQLEWRQALSEALNRVFRSSKMSLANCDWALCHRHSDEFLYCAASVIPGVLVVERVRHRNVNFGCVDPLVSLHEISCLPGGLPQGIGLVLFAGRFGAVGALLLRR